MCFDPISLLTAAGISAQTASAVGTAAAVAGAATSAVGTYASMQGQAATAKANAEIADQNAAAAKIQGEAQASQIRDRYRALSGKQEVAAAKSGINPATGSASLLINQETEKNAFLDIASTIWNKSTEANAYQNRANALRSEAATYSGVAPFAAGGSFLSGIGNASKGVRLS